MEPVLIVLLLLPTLASAAPLLAWPLSGVSVTATDSFKWVVRGASDGAGGAILAWEENRGRHLCCRDTRDIYAQRLDAAGRTLWGGDDVKVATEEPGEEVLGVAPAGNGGAFMLWRRGRGMLLAQELDPEGRSIDGPAGVPLRDTAAPCEWPQLTGFAVTPAARRAMLVWTEGEMPGPSSITAVVANRSGTRWLVTPVRALLTQPGLHAAAVVACGEERWCVLWWSRTTAGLTVGGLWLAGDGTPQGRPFMIGQDADLQYGHVEGAGAGPNRAFVIWSAVHPEHLTRTHVLHAAVLTARAGGGTLVSTVDVGQALSQAMFIPPTVVQVGASAEVAATQPIVAWRQTAALIATSADTAVVSWLDGRGLMAAGLLGGSGRLACTATLTVSGDANAGFSPLLAPVGPGAVVAAWAAQTGPAVRAAGRVLHIADRRLETAGDPLILADGGTQLPRVACAIASAASSRRGAAIPGSVILAWNVLGGGDHGAVIAQRITFPPP